MATVVTTSPAVNVPAVAWHAIAKVASKEAVRDDLQAGVSHLFDLSITGTVDGEPFERSLAGTLSVGHDVTKATSTTPALPLLVGHILAKLNQATREKVLRELPEQFEAAGCELPPVEEELAARVESMLVRLRAKQQVVALGAVSCKYAMQPELSVVG